MWAYVIRKLLLLIPTAFVVLVILFLMLRVVPGDPVMSALGSEASEQAVQALRTELGLDQPLYIQFIQYVEGILQGDLGRSLVTRTSITKEIATALPYTMSYAVGSLVVAIVLGILFGVVTAVKRNTIIDYLGRVFSLAGLSFPEFYLGLLLMLLLAVHWDILPAVGAGDFNNPKELIRHLILPSITGGLIMTAYITRLTRSSMLDVIREDYIATARAKGLRESTVILRHALKNALISIVTIIGMYFGLHFAGSIMVEMIFARPGMGKLLLSAIKQNDYNVVQSVIFVYCLIIMVVNLITDVVYGWIDPRIVYK
ncbi:MAG: ABC transporter permease [Desulfobacteraceae bacterium]|nr:ABC transporter permease [Desulfobacteraceae bacterium]